MAEDAGFSAELRRDPLRGHWSVIAPGRARRPIVQGPSDPTTAPQHDPFLAGNEEETPAELFSVPDDDGAWSVRVVPNRYPALTPEAHVPATDSLFEARPATGQQEVIVECPQFEEELSSLGVTQIERVVTAWQHRLRAVRDEGRFDHVLVFKNSGRRAGASLPHAHSQLLATERVPDVIAAELQRAEAFHDAEGAILMDRIVAAESEAGRLVLDAGGVVAFCPFASRFAGEVWIVPAGSPRPFHDSAGTEPGAVASALHQTLSALRAEYPGVAYNLILHATPFSVCDAPWFRWRLEICPRQAVLAGFELGTGCYVNHVAPEQVARSLAERMRFSAE